MKQKNQRNLSSAVATTRLAACAALLVLSLPGPGAALGEEPVCNEHVPTRDHPEDLVIEWRPGAGANPQVEVRAPSGETLDYTLRMRVSFGPLEHTWTQGPYQVEPGDTARLDVDIPAEAFLHQMAADYMSRLLVRVETRPRGGRGEEVMLPSRMLAWPSGSAGPAVIWDRVTAARKAPHGVTSEAVRAALPSGLPPDAWVHPPLYHLFPLQPTTDEDANSEENL